MEEVLLALFVYCILSGKNKFVGVHSELCLLLQRSPNAIGSVLKNLKQFELIDYYRKGRHWVVELKLSNLFITSLMARFFGFKSSLNKTTEQFGKAILGFYPLDSKEETHALFSNRLIQLDSQIAYYQEWLTWYDEIITLEKSAKRLPIEHQNQDNSNRYVLFVDKFLSRISKQQAIQTQTVSYKEIKKILEQLLDDYRILPPWIGGGSSFYSPLKIDEDEL